MQIGWRCIRSGARRFLLSAHAPSRSRCHRRRGGVGGEREREQWNAAGVFFPLQRCVLPFLLCVLFLLAVFPVLFFSAVALNEGSHSFCREGAPFIAVVCRARCMSGDPVAVNARGPLVPNACTSCDFALAYTAALCHTRRNI